MKLLACFLLSSLAWSQDLQPNVVNAKFEARAFSGDLRSDLRASTATWFGYSVKSKRHRGDDCCNSCRLEWSSQSCAHVSSTRSIPLEGSGLLALLFRVEHGSIEKMEVRSIDCSLDAGGLPFVWVNGVPPAVSALFLKSLVVPNASDHLANAAIVAISQHADAAALAILEDLAHPPAPAHVRSQALFWLAQEAGNRAGALIEGAIDNDPDTEVKKQAVFALSQLPAGEGVPKLIEVARQNRNPEVRKQAFFWLGQSNDQRALAFIEQVLAR